MLNLFPKLRSKIKGVRKKLGPVLPVILTALLGALLLWGTGYLFDLFWLAPAADINGVFSGTTYLTISPSGVTALVGFLLGALAGTWYFAYRPNRETVMEYWAQVPTWTQATLIGLAGALAVTAGLFAVQVYWGLSDLTVVSGFLLVWPASTGMVILRRRCIGDDCPPKTSMRIGYTHAKGLESRTMAIILGSLVGVFGGLLTWYLSIRIGNWGTALPAVVVAVLLWAGVTLVIYNRYDEQTAERTNLAIAGVNRPKTRDTWELHIKNESSDSIDLSLAKIRDTEFDLYKFGVDTTLGPGETCTFNAPEGFRLAPNDDSWELPLGYTLKQGSETPAILTRTGEMYGLQRDQLDGPDGGPTGARADVTATGQSNPSGEAPETPASTQD
ncbi:lamin tail domain-containing protein [Haloarcula sp. S1CR25-12]|uniref:Lamin tail domain-containing protein n=1 Tax=Haloarcula saliterrae TaxID=2950534 RepID=A0ABU2FE19_9EURY|nr:hypothetical protein [Haloarcula sp. S1CR25-12]MDS0260505.1 lamin tail domain-containing protein [Haloarcula sp. S1CR25-12]